MYKIRTIDVWDTLLRRDCHPECIKVATAHHLLFGWHDQIKPEFRDSWLLYKARVEAESVLALKAKLGGRDDEYEITQVLAHWAKTIFVMTPPSALSVRLAEFELSVEMARSYADHGIADFIQSYNAEKTLFLSDFYMGADMLNRLLASKGLSKLVSDGISSCDEGFNKKSGKIFLHVHKIHAVTPEEHIHIGDNEWSDVASPSSLGIKSLHYLPECEHTARLICENLFSSRDKLFEHIRVECTNIIQNSSTGLSSKQAEALSLSLHAAPTLIGFVLWIAEQAIQHKLDRLYFLPREGEFLHRVFCAILPKDQLFGHNLPTVGVLEVSRLATFALPMRDLSITEITRIWTLLEVQSVSSLFIELGLDIEEFNEAIETLGLDKDEIVREPHNRLDLRKLFETPEFVAAAEKSLKKQTNLLHCYLAQSGFNEIKRVGIVDIDNQETLQDNISKLMPDSHFHCMYLNMSPSIPSEFINGLKSAYLTDEKESIDENYCHRHYTAMNLIFKPPRRTIAGNTSDYDHTKENRYDDERENVALDEFTRQFQDGILLSAKIWQPYLERYVVSSDDLHKIAVPAWKKLCKILDQYLLTAHFHQIQKASVENNIPITFFKSLSFFKIIFSYFPSSRQPSLFDTKCKNKGVSFIGKSRHPRSLNQRLVNIFYRIKLISKIRNKIASLKQANENSIK
jgi:FMN phosphatase YigB (HAD superfamily)